MDEPNVTVELEPVGEAGPAEAARFEETVDSVAEELREAIRRKLEPQD